MAKKSLLDYVEIQEQIQILNEKGYGKLVDAILSNENKAFTKKCVRLNKSGVCRLLGCKVKELEQMFAECRSLLGEDDD